jgi:hypothetical protein
MSLSRGQREAEAVSHPGDYKAPPPDRPVARVDAAVKLRPPFSSIAVSRL